MGSVIPKPLRPKQPKVPAQMDAVKPMTTPDGPTDVEMNDDQYNIDKKRKGRRSTVLTSVTGDTSTPKLSKKSFTGRLIMSLYRNINRRKRKKVYQDLNLNLLYQLKHIEI